MKCAVADAAASAGVVDRSPFSSRKFSEGTGRARVSGPVSSFTAVQNAACPPPTHAFAWAIVWSIFAALRSRFNALASVFITDRSEAPFGLLAQAAVERLRLSWALRSSSARAANQPSTVRRRGPHTSSATSPIWRLSWSVHSFRFVFVL